jgi:hypothetical protein
LKRKRITINGIFILKILNIEITFLKIIVELKEFRNLMNNEKLGRLRAFFEIEKTRKFLRMKEFKYFTNMNKAILWGS